MVASQSFPATGNTIVGTPPALTTPRSTNAGPFESTHRSQSVQKTAANPFLRHHAEKQRPELIHRSKLARYVDRSPRSDRCGRKDRARVGSQARFVWLWRNPIRPIPRETYTRALPTGELQRHIRTPWNVKGYSTTQLILHHPHGGGKGPYPVNRGRIP